VTYSLANHLLATLERAGAPVRQGARVLDFGCGEGALVYEFRDKGFEAYGFDQHVRAKLRSEEDRAYFGFSGNGADDTSNQIMTETYRIPFPDGFFDLVVSTSVIEHVIDLPRVNAEIARVTAPSGCALHTYPSILTPVEPHTMLPLGGLIRSRLWVRLWATLGVRNEFYEGWKAGVVSDAYSTYYKTGLFYHTRAGLHRIMRQNFTAVTDVSAEWYGPSPKWNFWKTLVRAARQRFPLRHIALHTPLHAVLAKHQNSQH
jgi:SAM-dependent methyltransferase